MNKQLWNVLLYTSDHRHMLFVVIAASHDIALDLAIHFALSKEPNLSFKEQFAYQSDVVQLIGQW